MVRLFERLQTPISTAELRRLRATVRTVLEREQIDALSMHSNGALSYVLSRVCDDRLIDQPDPDERPTPVP